MNQLKTIAVVGFLAATVLPAAAVEISGAGATFPYPVYAKWADAYQKETGLQLNYQSIGSGGGIKQIQARTVTFGASDAPLKGADLEKGGLVQFPMVMGGIVPVVNLEGIKAGDLVLDGRGRHRSDGADAGVVDQDVGGQPATVDLVEKARASDGIRDVATDYLDAHAAGEFVGQLAQPVLAACDECDAVPTIGELARDGRADARRCAGDDGGAGG